MIFVYNIVIHFEMIFVLLSLILFMCSGLLADMHNGPSSSDSSNKELRTHVHMHVLGAHRAEEDVYSAKAPRKDNPNYSKGVEQELSR